ncbi:6271_t:CDS:2, partial [Ambispora leptoticha]
VSCCDEHLNRVYESEMKIERNEKGKVDVMNRVDELGDNEVKGKEVKVKNDVEEVVMNRVGNDYANDKVKTKIGKTIKNNKNIRSWKSLARELVENYANLGISFADIVGNLCHGDLQYAMNLYENE